MGDIQHELKVGASRPKIIEALTTLAGLERWNRARVSGGPQEWTVGYPDGPAFRWKVVEATNDKITWRCEEGPGNAKGSEVSFTLSDADKSRTLIRLEHRQRAGSDPNHQKCDTLWGVLLGRLQQEVEGFRLAKTHD